MPKRGNNPQLVILGVNPLGLSPHEAYQRFHWTEPDKVLEVPRPEGIDADALILIGRVHEIIYSTSPTSERSKISRLWTHKFREPALLCTTPAGDVLVVLGGRLKVSPRGIEG